MSSAATLETEHSTFCSALSDVPERRSTRDGRGTTTYDPDGKTSAYDGRTYRNKPQHRGHLVKVYNKTQGHTYQRADAVPSQKKRNAGDDGKAAGVHGGGGGGKRKPCGGGRAGGAKRKAGRDGGGGAKRKAGGTGGVDGGGASASTGGGRADGNGNDGGADPMEESDDDTSRATFDGDGGGSDSEWSAGGNGGGDGGGDTDGESDFRSCGSDVGSDDGGSDSDDSGSDCDYSDSDSDHSDSGDTDRCSVDSGSSGSSGRSRGGGDSCGRKKYQSGKKQPDGRARVTTQELIEILTAPSSDPRYEKSDKEHMAACRKEADEKKKRREGTAPRAGGTKYGIGSMPNIARVLRGLTEDSRGLPLKNGVFFDRDELPGLKDDFNIAYFLDPKHIDVQIDKTRVVKGGRELVVKSFNNGEYTLGDDLTKMRQWELLECRKGGRVTLHDALRRFILHLVTTQTIMKLHGAPFVRSAGRRKQSTMLWNIDDAIRRLEKDDGAELADGEMGLSELRDLKVRRFLRDAVRKSCVTAFLGDE